MSFSNNNNYSSFVSDENTNMISNKLPIHYLETTPSKFSQNNSTQKSFWQPGSDSNNKLLDTHNIRNNSNYRKYMTQHADEARSYNEKEYKAQLSK